MLPALVEGLERSFAFAAGRVGQHRERGELVAHVVGTVELLHGDGPLLVRIELVQIGQAQVAQAPARRLLRFRLVRLARRQRGVTRGKIALQPGRQVTRQAASGLVQGLRIDDRHLLGQRRFAGQRQRLGDESRITGSEQHLACGNEHRRRPDGRGAKRDARRRLEDELPEKSLPGLPAIE